MTFLLELKQNQIRGLMEAVIKKDECHQIAISTRFCTFYKKYKILY